MATDKEILDRAEILKQIGGNEETLKQIVALFATESAQNMAQIRHAIMNEDASELQRAAHTLKASVRIFGAERAAAVALQLETMGREGNLLAAEETRLVLEKELERLMPLLIDMTGP